jgi:hypothetical protein
MRATPPIGRPCGAAVVTVTTPASQLIAVIAIAAPVLPTMLASVCRLIVKSELNSITSM